MPYCRVPVSVLRSHMYFANCPIAVANILYYGENRLTKRALVETISTPRFGMYRICSFKLVILLFLMNSFCY